jgi:hypothetical protein
MSITQKEADMIRTLHHQIVDLKISSEDARDKLNKKEEEFRVYIETLKTDKHK